MINNAAMGALVGALVGDAAGGVLEFLGRGPTSNEVAHALTFPGGGVHRLAPGQITDDGELMLSLAIGLTAEGCKHERLECIAGQYHRWQASRPFDIGNTTMSSIGAAFRRDFDEGTCAEKMTAAAASRCWESKANGSLMRCMPIAVWGHRMTEEALVSLARSDSRLSHPNPACTDSVAAYTVALAHLINNPGDHLGAFNTAADWVRRDGCPEVGEWVALARDDRPAPFHPMAGFVKIAFTHAFAHLARGTSYPDALAATLLGGGDTDTNACIVGGLIGALHGSDTIPEDWRESVLGCDTAAGRQRPSWLSASGVLDLVPRLLSSGPAALPEG